MIFMILRKVSHILISGQSGLETQLNALRILTNSKPVVLHLGVPGPEKLLN
jgi:hypothetical protein